MDIQTLRKTYARFNDDKITRLVKDDLYNLTADAVTVLQEEVIKRQLPLLGFISCRLEDLAEFNKMIDGYCDYVRSLPCPICGSTEEKLNGVQVSNVTSFIYFTRHTKKFHIGCPPCLTLKRSSAHGASIALGWWGFPFGIIETISSISKNKAAQRNIDSGVTSSHLRDFVAAEVVNYRSNEGDLLQYLDAKVGQLL